MDVEVGEVGPEAAVGTDRVSDGASVEGATAGSVGTGTAGRVLDVDPESSELLAALEGADDLALDDRLELLRHAESSIAGVLEGLDGL